MAEEINKYSRQHRLNVEGIYDPFKKTQNSRSDFSKISSSDLKKATTNDKISHFICRLAYCRNDELRKWFVTQETRLFYHRLASFEPKDVLSVLRDKCNMNYEQLTQEDSMWIKFKD
jgi:DNA primase large subunit